VKATTPTIEQSTNLTRRQQLNRRIALDVHSGKLLNRLAECALGIEGREMSMAEIRAAEIVLRKSVPDLAAQILVAPENDNLSREELAMRISELANSNPQLALVAGLDIVIDKAKTVATIEKQDKDVG